MTTNSVKELKEKLEAEMEKEKDFERRLMQKYPSLFNKDESGNLLSPDCGISCPPGWQHLVEHLCENIVWRLKNGRILEPKKFRFLSARVWIWNKIFYKLQRLVDPTTKAFSESRAILSKQVDAIKKAHPRRTLWTNRIGKIGRRLVPVNKYNLRPIPEVKIGQIKEKFGTLRFYYDGGDEVIRGMVSFAEYLSGRMCEMTGEAGSLCKKGKGMSWYKTLSERKANEIGYTKVE